jgi:hypothetical protein
MSAWWKRFLELTSRGATPSRLRVVAQDGGIIIGDNRLDEDGIILPWKEVTRVVAYRRDMYVSDLLCLAVEFDGLKTVEIDETMQGWQEFMTALPSYLTGSRGAEEFFLSLIASPDKNDSVVVFTRKEIQAQELLTASADNGS